ncbi:Photosystem I assembly protein Ycf3 [uncultured archaeon]|nr:Photosystem I assembly protein Ycf3 [uncultured archaeon]
MKLDEELGIKEGMAAEYGNMGNVYQTRGEPEKALEYYEKALLIFRDMRSRIQESIILMNIGDVFVNKAKKERALDYYMQAQELAKGSYIFEDINKRLQKLRNEVIAKDTQKSTTVKAIS